MDADYAGEGTTPVPARTAGSKGCPATDSAGQGCSSPVGLVGADSVEQRIGVAVLGARVGRSRLPVENAGEGDLCLFIEPYGEDFHLKPGEVFTVAAEAEGIDVWFSTLVWEGGITVWPYEDGDPTKIVLEYAVTDANGTRLECGHQRPPGPAGSDVAELG